MIARPFLKWPGGKRSLLPELLKRAPSSFGAYHEPFVGGGALYFALQASSNHSFGAAVLSDTNTRLMRTYRALQMSGGADDIVRKLKRMKNTEEFFIRTRGLEPEKTSMSASAAWMIYLNKTCFNGLYRVNRSGGFNAPFGRYVSPAICDEDNLRAVHRLLRDKSRPTLLRTQGFENVERQAQKGDFVYFDPPYLPVSKTSNFTAYTESGFGKAAHTLLRDVARSLKDQGVQVLISNCGHPFIRELYADGFFIDEVRAARSINSNGGGRGELVDLLIW